MQVAANLKTKNVSMTNMSLKKVKKNMEIMYEYLIFRHNANIYQKKFLKK